MPCYHKEHGGKCEGVKAKGVEKMSKMRKITRFYRGDPEQYEQADYWEREAAWEILSSIPTDILMHITFDFAPGAGTSEKFDKSPFNPNRPWDIEFFYDDKIFAYVEVVNRPTITFQRYPSQFIRDYKVEALPKIKKCVFFLYAFPKAAESQRYHWTTREKAKVYPKRGRDTWIPELRKCEWQENYEVDTEAWECGIESLIKELLKIVERLTPKPHSKQATLMRKKSR